MMRASTPSSAHLDRELGGTSQRLEPCASQDVRKAPEAVERPDKLSLAAVNGMQADALQPCSLCRSSATSPRHDVPACLAAAVKVSKLSWSSTSLR